MRKSSMARGRIHVFRRAELLQTSQALKFRRVHHSDAARVQLDVAEDRIIENLGLVCWWWRRLGAGALAGRRGHDAATVCDGWLRAVGYGVDACGCGSTACGWPQN